MSRTAIRHLAAQDAPPRLTITVPREGAVVGYSREGGWTVNGEPVGATASAAHATAWNTQHPWAPVPVPLDPGPGWWDPAERATR